MNLWEVSFRTQYEYPFIEMSGRFPGTSMSLWCIWNRELLQIPTQNKPMLDAVEKELKKGGWIIEKWGDAHGGRTFFLNDTCAKWKSIWNIVEPHECLLAPPAVFADGWCYSRVLSFEESATRAMFKELQANGRTELISKRELPLSVLPSSVSRSTYEEHLRKAENRVMDALIPYLQLYAQGQKTPETLPLKGTAVEEPDAAA